MHVNDLVLQTFSLLVSKLVWEVILFIKRHVYWK